MYHEIAGIIWKIKIMHKISQIFGWYFVTPYAIMVIMSTNIYEKWRLKNGC